MPRSAKNTSCRTFAANEQRAVTPSASSHRLRMLLTPIGWILGSGVSFWLLFQAIRFSFQYLPEPIGSRADLFAEGAAMTLRLTLWSGVLGLFLGVFLGMGKLSKVWVIRQLCVFLVWIVRGTPLMVQILFVYYALPELLKMLHIPLSLDEFQSGMVALALNVGAYNAEVIRAGILAVPRGQTEAAQSLGLSSTQTMQQVVLPQALKMVIPPLVNNGVGLLKDTSLVSSIALLELSLVGTRISSETFQPVPVLTTVASVYLLLTTVMTFFTNILERRLRVDKR